MELLFNSLRLDGFDIIASKPVNLMTYSGEEEIAFGSVEDCNEYLVENGGGVSVFSSSEDLFISVHPKNKISVSVMRDLKVSRASDREPAKIFVGIFERLCKCLSPKYAYSTDEYLLEEITGNELVEIIDVTDKSPYVEKLPPLLFWMNYFRKDYFGLIEIKISGANYDIQRSEKGVFLFLANRPWQAKISKLNSQTGFYDQSYQF
jgi:hypothetical protein